MVTGTIEDIGSFEKSTSKGEKTIHFLVVGGKKYNNGFWAPSYGKDKPAKIGDEVEFESVFEYGSNNVVPKTLRRKGQPKFEAPAPAPQNDTLRIRIAALSAAAVSMQHSAPGGGSLVENVVFAAKAFEDYLQGE